MDIWPWICDLQESHEFTQSDSYLRSNKNESTREIQLRPARVSGSTDSESPKFIQSDSHLTSNKDESTRSIQLRAARVSGSTDSEAPEFTQSNSNAVFHLTKNKNESTRSIQLRAERVSGRTDSESVSIVFKVIVTGFNVAESTIWVSEMCPLSSEKPFLPLILQLLRELISQSPTTRDSVCSKSKLLEIKPGPVSWVMESHSPEYFSTVFNLIFLIRLFWLFMFESHSEIGSFFFQSLLNPHINSLTCQNSTVLRTFLVSLGIDIELCIVRAASYAISKWMISKELGLKKVNTLPRHPLGFSYATESHGLWILKGYFPILSMKITNSNELHKISNFPIMDPKETVLRYALSHQQAETIVQFDYSVKFHENYIKVNARVDNIRVHVTKLGFHKEGMENEIVDCYSEERYFLSRVRVWVGPEVGSSKVSGLSLGRSSKNEEREVEVTRVIKGNFGNLKVSPRVKARARMSTRRKMKDWRMEQESDGNTAVLDMVLYERESGEEVMNVKGGERGKLGFKDVFRKSGGLVFGRDEFGDEIGWRIGKEMEGNVMKWRIGGQIWLTYWPNKLTSGFYETRCVEWCDEIDLPLVPTS